MDTDADDLNAETVALAGRVLAGLVLASDSRRDSVSGLQEMPEDVRTLTNAGQQKSLPVRHELP